MTLSMLEGSDGNQRKEVMRLIEWLKAHEKPDLVHLSNALLIGLAAEIKAALNVPVVCSLQDEDGWLDSLELPFRERCWAAVADRAGDVDQFVAVSRWYADRMMERLSLPEEKVSVVHIGIDLEGMEPASQNFDPPVLGYLSRMNEELGLGKLVDAFVELKTVQGLETLQLRVMGGMVGSDKKDVARCREKLAKAGVEQDAEFRTDVERAERIAFLKSLSVLSVPVEQGEAFGTYMIEAMAVGVPVVQPDAGAFPELIAATGGGLIYQDLVETLRALLMDPDRVRELGRTGREAVVNNFSIETMAKNIIPIYEKGIENDF
jgi:glycosyltransferase involved in cell wall biosynthesis